MLCYCMFPVKPGEVGVKNDSSVSQPGPRESPDSSCFCSWELRGSRIVEYLARRWKKCGLFGAPQALGWD